MPDDPTPRGSDLLRQRLEAQLELENRVLTPADLEPIFALADRDDAQVVSFWLRGQPDPDTVGGTVRTTQEHADRIVSELVKSEKLQLHITIQVLPYGSADVSFGSPGIGWPHGQPSPEVLDTDE